MQTNLTSVDAVIDALGGTGATASLLGYRSNSPVSNWRARGRLPADKFLVMQDELKRRGLIAPPTLWGISAVEEHAA